MQIGNAIVRETRRLLDVCPYEKILGISLAEACQIAVFSSVQTLVLSGHSAGGASASLHDPPW
jgi:hypothetical protein